MPDDRLNDSASHPLHEVSIMPKLIKRKATWDHQAIHLPIPGRLISRQQSYA
jgi:hypothetical protein